jgi:tight adherence protein B
LNELGVITLLVFAAALFGIVAIYWLAFEARNTQKSISRRLTLSREYKDQAEVLDALRHERGIFSSDIPAIKQLNEWLTQTGLRLDRNWLLFSVFAATAALFIVFGFVFDFGIGSFALALFSALVLIIIYLRTVRRRRIDRFAEQLPDAVEIIVRGIRVGYPVSVALDLVAREMPDPIGSEFGMTADEISFGQNIKSAMENLHRRVGQDDLQFLIVAVNIQTQTGGNLAEVLLRLSRLIRSRSKIALKIRALSAEGRISAKFLSLMPFIMVGIISLVSPSFFAEVRHSPAIEPALIYAAISLVIGNLVMYRMVNFKF